MRPVTGAPVVAAQLAAPYRVLLGQIVELTLAGLDNARIAEIATQSAGGVRSPGAVTRELRGALEPATGGAVRPPEPARPRTRLAGARRRARMGR
ncbi:hypothetical protein LX83_006516 [Goodfellowiella coeruleoviolacea]|uniref:Uncharacterized protein n=1 Tax=Goodfellowiella coeruleoviolacea TaxID=334858 RepID=A0AAE3GK19_9PSEU|nr:hypothetical protein [Goodfellowiella coeruleoviolacea]